MELSIASLPSLIPFLRLAVLLILFVYLFATICTTAGRCVLLQVIHVVSFFGVCTSLGAVVVPEVVNGAWASVGSTVLIAGGVILAVYPKSSGTENTAP